MKRIIKSRIFAFILGAVIFSGMTVLATEYMAENIGFIPKDTTWKKQDGSDITNVKDAIDELYVKANVTVTFNYSFESVETSWTARTISNLNLAAFKDQYKKVSITAVNVPSTCNSFEYKIYNSSWGNETTPVIGTKYNLADFPIIYGYARAKTSGTSCFASLTISLSN